MSEDVYYNRGFKLGYEHAQDEIERLKETCLEHAQITNSLLSKLARYENDIQAYRFALGYEVPAQYGKLSDGTEPKCGLCEAKDRMLSCHESGIEVDGSVSIHTGLLINHQDTIRLVKALDGKRVKVIVLDKDEV